jgi:hypothetical protein
MPHYCPTAGRQHRGSTAKVWGSKLRHSSSDIVTAQHEARICSMLGTCASAVRLRRHQLAACDLPPQSAQTAPRAATAPQSALVLLASRNAAHPRPQPARRRGSGCYGVLRQSIDVEGHCCAAAGLQESV